MLCDLILWSNRHYSPMPFIAQNLTLLLLFTYVLGMNGIAGIEPDKLTENLQPLFQEILKLPKAKVSYIILSDV